MDPYSVFEFLDWIDQQNKVSDATVYHYAKGDTTKKILRENGIVLRLTRVEDFKDKYEGKATLVCYDLALIELLEEGNISQKEYELLCDAEPTTKCLVFQKKDKTTGADVYAREKYVPYVICFSNQKDNDYMFEHYASGDNLQGCIGFYPAELREELRVQMRPLDEISIQKIMYGRETIKMLKQAIERVVSILRESNDETSQKYCRNLIDELLRELQYPAKMGRFWREDEKRLIIFLPNQDNLTEEQKAEFVFNRGTEDGKEYIEVCVPKYCFEGISFSQSTSQEDAENMRQYLTSIGYSCE